MTDIETRYRKLVEEAYSAAEVSNGYQDVLEQTHKYLFRDEARLHADLPRSAGRDVALEMHLPQLKALFQKRHFETTSSDLNYAVLTLRISDGRTCGNIAAEKLFNRTFPCQFEALPIDRASLQKIIRVIHNPRSDLDVLLIHIGDNDPMPCLATIKAVQPQVFEVSISFLDWTEELTSKVGKALGLSQKEQQVFAGFARNLSQSQIAERYGRSVETVRSQSKNILRKTGCARMSDVVQTAAGLAYLLKDDSNAPAITDDTLKWETPKAGMSMLPRPDGRHLAYYTRGTGRHDVLFLHGFLQGPFFTDEFEQRLTEADIRLICPSRPGFGYTTSSKSRSDYEQTALEDAIALLDHLQIERTVLVCHQMSTNHAFRLKANISSRINAMVMVSAAPPIDDKYLKRMETMSRIAAATARHAPSILKLINEVGIHSYRRKGGPHAFLKSRYKSSPLDLSTLDDPVLLQPQIDGVFHYIEQGSETLVRDATSSMANWTPIFTNGDCAQYWLHGAQCAALDVDIVSKLVTDRVEANYDIIQNTSTNLIHQRPDIVVSMIRKCVQQTVPECNEINA